MKNRFILYVIALLLLCNVIFQFTHLTKLEAIGAEVKGVDAELQDVEQGGASSLSTFQRDQGKVTDSLKATISQLQKEIAAAKADNGRLRAELVKADRRLKKVELRLFPPPPPKK